MDIDTQREKVEMYSVILLAGILGNPSVNPNARISHQEYAPRAIAMAQTLLALLDEEFKEKKN